MKPELKKLLVLNLPYLLFVYLFAKCGQTYRLAAGADASAKLLHLTSGISAAFANPLPSLHPFDLCVGVVGAVAVRLIVYSKGKNAKKYRKGEEYGSARWGTAKDIAPYIVHPAACRGRCPHRFCKSVFPVLRLSFGQQPNACAFSIYRHSVEQPASPEQCE